LADFTVEERGGQPVVRITGEIDASNVDKLGRRVRESVSNEALGLIVDLCYTTYIDSAGVRLLFDLARRLEGRGLELHLVVAEHSQVDDVLDLVALDTVAQRHRNMAAAHAALDHG
jgi:anti-sigma B factor antagonist/stage II sporulation protein AA (anti-sigma F factor antagonist)